MVALTIATFGLAASPPAGAGSEAGDADRVLAVVNAARGTFRESGDGYRLVLTGVASPAIWFSDRPARAVGSLTIDQLVTAFFSGDATPNAALEVFEGPGAGDVVVVELSNPRQGRGTSRLVLDARILSEDELADSALRAHAERATSSPPKRFGAAALYVDDAAACLLGDGGTGGDGGAGGLDPSTSGDGGSGGNGGLSGYPC